MNDADHRGDLSAPGGTGGSSSLPTTQEAHSGHAPTDNASSLQHSKAGERVAVAGHPEGSPSRQPPPHLPPLEPLQLDRGRSLGPGGGGSARGGGGPAGGRPPALDVGDAAQPKARNSRIEAARASLRAASLKVAQMEKDLGVANGTARQTPREPPIPYIDVPDKPDFKQQLVNSTNPLLKSMQDGMSPTASPGPPPIMEMEDWYRTRPLETMDMEATTGVFDTTFPPRNTITRGNVPLLGMRQPSSPRSDFSDSGSSAPTSPVVPERRRGSKGGQPPLSRRASVAVGKRSSVTHSAPLRPALQAAESSLSEKVQSAALAHKFTVTAEIMSIIKAKQKAAAQKGGWSPSSWAHQSNTGINDVESNINAYVEYVCDDLRTAEKRKRAAGMGTYVIDPATPWKKRWDTMILLLIGYSAYSVPYKAAFQTGASAPYEMAIDLIFLFDVILNFFTSYEESDGLPQNSLKKIRLRYVKTWFVFDLVSSIPIDFFSGNAGPVARNVFVALRLLKLLRLVRFFRLLESREAAIFFRPTILRLVNSFLLLSWFWHIISCLYWFIATSEGLGSTSWGPEASVVANTNILNYFLSVVWTIQTTFSCGLTTPAETLIEALFTILCFMVGIFMNAYVIGSAGSALQNLDEEKQAKRQLMDRIISYMKKRKLPTYFQRIILDFYTYTSDKHSEDDIFKDLPPAIQLRLSLLLNRELVKNIPLLKQLELNTIVSLMQTLQSRMFLPGDFVFKIGEKGECLYFVKTGQLELMLDDENVVSILQKGDMFGQAALQDENGIQEFNVRAAVYTEVLFLTKAAYLELANESDKFGELVETEAIKQEQFIVRARKNLKRHNKLGRMQSTKNVTGGSRRNLTMVEEMQVTETARRKRLMQDVAGALFSSRKGFGNSTKVFASTGDLSKPISPVDTP